MTARTKQKRHGPPPKAPAAGVWRAGRRRQLTAIVGALLVIAAIGAGIATTRSGGGQTTDSERGLPATPDYHSLLVEPRNPDALVLGTHVGLFRSGDAGMTWAPAGLAGDDAMNLVRPKPGQTVWLAGHDVFEKSTDGGRTWQAVRSNGLPGLDIHGFAVDPTRPTTLWAALAGQGLYASSDEGRTFAPVSREVGGSVMALAVLPGGELLAGDMGRGLLQSRDRGRTWRIVVRAQVTGIAVNPKTSALILASGPDVIRSADGGKTWTQQLELNEGTGPVAWAPSRPDRAYVVGYDRKLYRSDDAGKTWKAVQ